MKNEFFIMYIALSLNNTHTSICRIFCRGVKAGTIVHIAFLFCHHLRHIVLNNRSQKIEIIDFSQIPIVHKMLINMPQIKA